jgi:CRISPR-associated protein Cas5d
LRNEITRRQSLEVARRWAREGQGGFFAELDRAGYGGQRHSLILRDVSYLIRAQIELKPGVPRDAAMYRDQFRRRVANGRCFATPYLGCREFSASFAPADGTERPIEVDEELGSMLLEMEYDEDRSGSGRPHFFDARLQQGILWVPAGAAA